MPEDPQKPQLEPAPVGWLQGGMVWTKALRRRRGDPRVAKFVWGGGVYAGQWRVSGTVAMVGGSLVIGELTIDPDCFTEGGVPYRESDIPAGGVTSTTLRDVPIGKLLNVIRDTLLKAPQQIAEWEQTMGQPFEELRQQAQAAADAVGAVELRRGRKGYPDDHYRRVALEYLTLQGEGMSKGILNELARRGEKWVGRPVARETARDWVAEARRRGFLTKGSRGRAGASAGPRLYEPTTED